MVGVRRTAERPDEVANVGPERGDLNCEAALGVNFFLRGEVTMGGRRKSSSDGFPFTFNSDVGETDDEGWMGLRAGILDSVGETFVINGERNGVASFLCCNF